MFENQKLNYKLMCQFPDKINSSYKIPKLGIFKIFNWILCQVNKIYSE